MRRLVHTIRDLLVGPLGLKLLARGVCRRGGERLVVMVDCQRRVVAVTVGEDA